MKSTYVIGFVLFCATAAAQTTVIHVDTYHSGDSTTCISWAETANCTARFAMAVTVNDSEITIIETDTIAEKAFCECRYNLWASVRGLQMGNYTVTVIRQELKQYGYQEDRQFVVGSATFEIIKTYPFAFTRKVYQSPCAGIGIGRTSSWEFVLSAHPNPSAGDVTVQIRFTRGHQTVISVVIFDAIGRRITSTFKQEAGEGLELILPAALLKSNGIYYCVVNADNETKTLPFIILK